MIEVLMNYNRPAGDQMRKEFSHHFAAERESFGDIDEEQLDWTIGRPGLLKKVASMKLD
jgi:hypothetical protein